VLLVARGEPPRRDVEELDLDAAAREPSLEDPVPERVVVAGREPVRERDALEAAPREGAAAEVARVGGPDHGDGRAARSRDAHAPRGPVVLDRASLRGHLV